MIESPWTPRVVRLSAVILLLLMVLEMRLWSMQAIQGPHYLLLSEQNRLRDYVIPAPRGVIFDRHGQPLVNNRAAFTVSVLPMEVKDPQRLADALAPVLSMDRGEILARLAAGRRRRFEPVALRRDASKAVVMTIEENRLDLPGVIVQAEPARDHLAGRLAAHALGYLGEVTEEELKSRPGYRMGDLIGKAGLERTYDTLLRGKNGRLRVEVDAYGRPGRVLAREPAQPGQSLVLNLDATLQAVAEEALGDRTGAVVALDPRNGEVLVLASHPAFDPNQFSGGISPVNWQRLMGDRGLPLINRATEGAYEPGSVFKIFTGIAALSEGVASRTSVIHCPGSIRLGAWVFRDLKAHGSVNFVRGTQVSCNVMFWTLGRALGDERIHRYATVVGLGRPTGIDLPSESAGLIPSAEWKLRVRKEPWYPGETLNMAIGQGYVQTTPLQIARSAGALATGGRLVRPRLGRRILSPDGSELRAIPPEPAGRVPLNATAVETLREGMRAVVDGGTGRAATVPGLAMAGKTGSAENPRGIPHAWFVGYAPADNPSLVVVAFVEHGWRGGVRAAPIVKAVFAAAVRAGLISADTRP
ncbi:MAG: penicillin-binding protein 2 [bacterium]